MKFRYIKSPKLSYGGTQYRKGDIVEMESFDYRLSPDWFEKIEEIETNERIEMSKYKKEEVISNGDSKKPNKDLGSKRR